MAHRQKVSSEPPPRCPRAQCRQGSRPEDMREVRMSPGCALLRHRKVGRRYLVAGLLIRKRARSGQLGPHRSLMLTAILDKHKCLGLRSPCGRSLPLPFSLGDALAEEKAKALAKGSSFPLVSLIGDGLCLHDSRLSTVLHRLQRTRAAFLLVLHAGKCGLMLQSPRGLASEPGEEALSAEPQEMTWAAAVCRA